MQAKQPKILQQMLTRSAILIVVVVGLFYGYEWLLNHDADFDNGTAETTGWIAAISRKPSGAVACVIQPDGTVIESPGARTDATGVVSTDRELAWRPDGNRIFFSSDREDNVYNIFRWNLSSSKVMRRTLGKLAKTDPSFPSTDESGVRPLIIFGGVVWELDPGKGTAHRIYPPADSKDVDVQLDNADTAESGGAGSTQSRIKAACLFGKGQWLAMVVAGDDGDTLKVAQLADPGQQGKRLTLARGQRILIDADAADGKLVYGVDDFRWPDESDVPPEFIHNGVATRPFSHCLAIFDPSSPAGLSMQSLIGASINDRGAFQNLAISPDGANIAVVVGPYSNGNVIGQALLKIPVKAHGSAEAVPLEPRPGDPAPTGPISDPAWNPTSDEVAFAMGTGANKTDIFTINADGTGLKNVTNGKGDFRSPKYSPQTK